jgi:hypothetical protein
LPAQKIPAAPEIVFACCVCVVLIDSISTTLSNEQFPPGERAERARCDHPDSAVRDKARFQAS